MRLYAEWEKTGSYYWAMLVQEEPNGLRHVITGWEKLKSQTQVEDYAKRYQAIPRRIA